MLSKSGNHLLNHYLLLQGRWNDLPCTGYYFNSVCKQKKYPGGTIPEETGCDAVSSYAQILHLSKFTDLILSIRLQMRIYSPQYIFIIEFI